VGLFVLIGAAALLFLALQSANLLSLSFQRPTGDRAFDNIGGLKPRPRSRAPAWWSGGSNPSCSTTRASRPARHAGLESRYQFSQGQLAQDPHQRPAGRAVHRHRGGRRRQEPRRPGDTITTTQSAVVLENLIGQFLYNKAAEAAPTPTRRQGVHRRNDEQPDRCRRSVAPQALGGWRSRWRCRAAPPGPTPIRATRSSRSTASQQFNEGVDAVLLKPTATLYRETVPPLAAHRRLQLLRQPGRRLVGR
jgi:phospholipid/cholesterol/gamma-HCH transport system substrate-binding protein